MQQPSPLINAILKLNSQGLATGSFLKQVTKQYPYFTAAQFYLLQQMEVSDGAYNQQAAKTALLFNNSHWLYFQLQHTDNAVEETGTVSLMNSQNTDNDDDAVEINAHITSSETIKLNTENKDDVPVIEKQPFTPEQLILTENKDNDDDAVEINTHITSSETIKLNTENKDDVPEIKKQPLTPEQLMLAENNDNDDDEAIIEKEIAPIKINISIPDSNSDSSEALVFEPMHLVDYFASQGIKLSDEVQPADKLGKQLKSFTEWLKTMKKVHVPVTEAIAANSDILVQTLAEKSNWEAEVVTEAMAEVLTQQGKVAKAIEVYKKLSLLNPPKSTFFAAKIEQLKG